MSLGLATKGMISGTIYDSGGGGGTVIVDGYTISVDNLLIEAQMIQSNFSIEIENESFYIVVDTDSIQVSVDDADINVEVSDV